MSEVDPGLLLRLMQSICQLSPRSWDAPNNQYRYYTVPLAVWQSDRRKESRCNGYELMTFGERCKVPQLSGCGSR